MLWDRFSKPPHAMPNGTSTGTGATAAADHDDGGGYSKRSHLYVRLFAAVFGYLWLANAANSRALRSTSSFSNGENALTLASSSSHAHRDLQQRGHGNAVGGTEGKKKKKLLVFVIPYRDRFIHWRKFQEAFRSKLHRRNEWDMHFYVIEQNDKGPFRRAWLINIGVAASIREFGEDNIGCIVTHDVDMLPDENVDYGACETPRQMCTEVTKSTVGGPKFKGNIPYEGFAGGVVSANPHHWRAINGMSNIGEGYGYEDDVLWNRLRHRDRLVREARHLNLNEPLEGNPFTNVSRYDQPVLRRAALGYGKCNQMDDGGHTKRVKDEFGWRQARREALDLSKRYTNWGSTGLNNTHCKVTGDTRDEDRQVRWIKVDQEREKENWLNKITKSRLRNQDKLPTDCPRLKPLEPDWGFNSKIYQWDKRTKGGKGNTRGGGGTEKEAKTNPLVFDIEDQAYRPQK